MKNYAMIANRYAERVLSGKITAPGWIRSACKNHLDDHAHKDSAHVFDSRQAERICRAVELVCGRDLQPAEIFLLSYVFGWAGRATGLSRA